MRNAEKTQGGAMALGPIGGNSKSLLYWAYCLEDKKGSRGQDKRRS